MCCIPPKNATGGADQSYSPFAQAFSKSLILPLVKGAGGILGNNHIPYPGVTLIMNHAILSNVLSCISRLNTLQRPGAEGIICIIDGIPDFHLSQVETGAWLVLWQEPDS